MKNISFILIVLFSLPTIVFSQNWNAVCVGINDYPGFSNDLDWCVNDATWMREYLITYKQWNASRINLLTNSDADEFAIDTAVSNMSRAAGNTNLFYFSGHGDSKELKPLYGTLGLDGLIPSNSWND